MIALPGYAFSIDTNEWLRGISKNAPKYGNERRRPHAEHLKKRTDRRVFRCADASWHQHVFPYTEAFFGNPYQPCIRVNGARAPKKRNH